jgi:cytochrome c
MFSVMTSTTRASLLVLTILLAGLAGLGGTGCVGGDPAAPEPSGAGEAQAPAMPTSDAPPPETFAAQVAAGKALFLQRCATCHGGTGEGRSGPRLVGLSAGALRSFTTARDVADYVLVNMPPGAAGTLSQQQAYDLVGFLVDANGIEPEPVVVLDPERAASVRLR